jgi:IS5 family transposase
VFRPVGDQPGLWESILPPELFVLPVELMRVDQLLDDPAFFAPFVPFFDPRRGGPSTPMESYLRLMFLKFRYRLGYESLCREVSDSITWRRFCRSRWTAGAAPDDLDEADDPVRQRGGRRAERGVAGQGSAGEAAAHHPGAGGHHGGPGRCGLSDRLRFAG